MEAGNSLAPAPACVAAGGTEDGRPDDGCLNRRPPGTPPGGLHLLDAEDAEAARTAIRLEGVNGFA